MFRTFLSLVYVEEMILLATVMTYPIVFLHGFPFSSDCWKSQVDFFSVERKVFAPDLRGHGKAPSPQGPWMISHFSDDLKVMFEKYKIEKAVICGLSMGGYIALDFIERYPDLVAGLVLCDTRADADSNEAKMKRYGSIQRIQKEGLEGFAEDFSKAVLGKRTLSIKPELKAYVKNIILSNQAESVAMTLGALASRKDFSDLLSKIKCPSLIIVGSDDTVTPIALSEAMQAKIAKSDLYLIEDAGHLSNLERPDDFNRRLQTFVSNIDQA